MEGHRRGSLLLLAAGLAATAHAVPSLYWGLGGDALVGTVGSWAKAWRDADPLGVGAVLVGIAAAKLAVGWLPWLIDHRWTRAPLWRRPAWVAALGLIAYGGVNTAAAWATLLGLTSTPVTEPAALLGHALLWDPLFLVWGVLLALGLRASERSRLASVRAVRDERLALSEV